jgi:hypothetical protein
LLHCDPLENTVNGMAKRTINGGASAREASATGSLSASDNAARVREDAPAASSVSTLAATAGWREATLLALTALPLAMLLLGVEPLAQDDRYHALADTRTLLGIPNFANVVSNAAFLLVGAFGLRLCLAGSGGGASASWTVFFLGAAAVAAGSAYYHWAPGDATLAWDRLPMTVVFMALFSALVSEHLRPALERVLLPAALVVGAASVAWWRYADDLRFYGWVQFTPLAIILFLLLAYRPRYTHRAYLGCGLLAYAAAKVAEAGDGAIFEWTADAVSGHTLKHLLAALALFAVYLMLRKRRRIA